MPAGKSVGEGITEKTQIQAIGTSSSGYCLPEAANDYVRHDDRQLP